MTANYVLLEKITVGAAGASSVTFSGIPQTGYTDLVVKVSGRSSRTGTSSGDSFSIAFNGVGGTSYSDLALRGSGSAATSYSDISQPAADLGRVPAAGQTASTFGNGEVYIPNYTGSTNKSISVDTVSENNAIEAYQTLSAGLFSNTAAITSINIAASNLGSWAQYSTFYLYGVAKLGTTPAIAPYATGGDTIMTDGTYWYHAFVSSGTFTPSKALSCDVLVVAGGASGGCAAPSGVAGAGGGAGGLVYSTSQSFANATAHTVTIGAGGAGRTYNAAAHQRGLNGSDSNVTGGTLSLTAAVGGGAGGVYPNDASRTALSGGSGGGGGADSGTGYTGAAGTSGQGNAGGNGWNGGGTAANGNAGGGGGAGAVGSNGTLTTAGAGGAGTNTYSTWLSTTGLGVSSYIAGGGGGGSTTTNTSFGAGGSGGGGAGGYSTASALSNGSAGTANTGSGGGGTAATGSVGGGNSGSGGSGIVIVRYTVA